MTRLQHLHNLLLLLLLQLAYNVSAISTAEDRQDVFLQCLNSMHHADTDHDNQLTRNEFHAFATEFSGQLYPHPVFTDGYYTNEERDLFKLLVQAEGGDPYNDHSLSIFGSAIEDLINVDQERFDTLHKVCRMAENAFSLLAKNTKPPKTMVMEFTMVEGNMNDEDGMTVKIKPLLGLPKKKKEMEEEKDKPDNDNPEPNDSGVELHGTHLFLHQSEPEQSTSSSLESTSDDEQEGAPKPKQVWDMSNATNSTPPLPPWMNNTNTTLRQKLEHTIAHRNDSHYDSSESIDEAWHKVHQNSVYKHNQEKLTKEHGVKAAEKKAKHKDVLDTKENAMAGKTKKKQTHVPDNIKDMTTKMLAPSESDSDSDEEEIVEPKQIWDMSNASNATPPLPYWMNTTNTTIRQKLEYTLLHRNDSTYDSSDESIDEIWHQVHKNSVYKHNQEKLEKQHEEKAQAKKEKHKDMLDQKEKAMAGKTKNKQSHVPDAMKNTTNTTASDSLDEYVEEASKNETKTKKKLKKEEDKIGSIEEDIEELIQNQTDLVLEHMALPDIEDSWEDSSDSEDFSFVWDEAFRQQQYQKNKKELEELKKVLNKEKIHLGEEKGEAMAAKVKSMVVSNFTPADEDFLRTVDGPDSKTAQRDDGKKKPPPPKKEEEDTTGMRKKPDFDAPPEGPDSRIANRNETLPAPDSGSEEDAEGEDDFDKFVINEAQINNQQKKNQEFHNKTAGDEPAGVSGSDPDEGESYSSESYSSDSGSWSSESGSWSSDSESDTDSSDPAPVVTINETLTVEELSNSIDSLEDYADMFDDDDDDAIQLDVGGDDKQILSLHTSFVIFNFENKTAKDIDIGENSTLHHAFADFVDLIMGTVCDMGGKGRAFGNCSGISKMVEKDLEEEEGKGSDEEGNTRRRLLEEEESEEKAGGLRAVTPTDASTGTRQLDGGEFRQKAGVNFDYTVLNPELYDMEDIDCPMKDEFPYKKHAPFCQTVFAHYNLLLNGLDGKIRQVEHNYMIITAKGIEHGRLRDSLQMIDPLSIHHVEGVGQKAFPTVKADHPEHLQKKADEAEKKRAEKKASGKKKSDSDSSSSKQNDRKAFLDEDPDDPNWENLLKMEGYKPNPEGLYAEDKYENSLVAAVSVIGAADEGSASRGSAVGFLVALTSTLAMNLWLVLV